MSRIFAIHEYELRHDTDSRVRISLEKYPFEQRAGHAWA
jgi:hypothetical protein